MFSSDFLSQGAPMGPDGAVSGAPRQGPLEGPPFPGPLGGMKGGHPERTSEGPHEDGVLDGPPPWQWPEAISFVLQQQLGFSAAALPCSTAAASNILRSLRFISRLLRHLLDSAGPPQASLTSGEVGASWGPPGGPPNPLPSIGPPTGGGPPGLPPIPKNLLSPRLREALEKSYWCLQQAEGGLWGGIEQLEKEETPSCHRVAALLADITSKLKSVAPGGAAFIPTGVRIDDDVAPVHMLFVVYRHPDSNSSSSSSSSSSSYGSSSGSATGGDTGDYLETHASRRRHFTVALINTSGFGHEYHAYAIEKCPSPEKIYL
ncbi:hypothetical protein, conserved [Eimeria maxima]|uniref:Uncharacterized protein n=1 Tax=Eimeria maxima TaxID=5804 RepID=U6MEH7_EIMMA|nr:hypothetical protein, conserved [Eimeria maxima]CDJ61468.1 hypothetical protein, conserved [Eimeria maxima]